MNSIRWIAIQSVILGVTTAGFAPSDTGASFSAVGALQRAQLASADDSTPMRRPLLASADDSTPMRRPLLASADDSTPMRRPLSTLA